MAEHGLFSRASTLLLALLLAPSGTCSGQETRTTGVQQHFANASDRVFRALTDLGGAANGMPGFVEVETLSEGAFGLGFQERPGDRR